LKEFLSQKDRGEALSIVLGTIVVLSVLGYGIYSLVHLNRENLDLKASLQVFEQSLAEVQSENTKLIHDLGVANGTVDQFAVQVEDLFGTVKKLNEINPELLKKYSKVYFLNENYVPRGLVNLASNYLLDPSKSLQLLTKVNAYLQNMMEMSIASGMNLKALSAYRSFDTQSAIKSAYNVTYGAGTANQFSAEQGYSEHQLGTAVDFTTPTIRARLSGFSRTPEYKWLIDNAYKYGFVLSYPENNIYYVYEPWHWRFVGVELATRLHEDKQYFYDLEQRQLDPYLLKIFD